MQKQIKNHYVDGNHNILANFRTIRVTPRIDPILNLQPLKKPLKIELEETNSMPDFENIDEKHNNYASGLLMSPNSNKTRGLNKFRAAAFKIIEKNRKKRQEEVKLLKLLL